MKQKIDKKNMNWAQAKWAFPKLKPNRDNDRDGVKNQFDCRPLNFKKQDVVETKRMLKKLKTDIANIQLNYKDYPEELDDALSNTSEWIED